MDFIISRKIIFQALVFLKTHLACWGEKWMVSSLGACPGNFRHQEGRESWLGFAVITQSDIHLLPWKDLERPRDSHLPLIFLSPFFQFYVWLGPGNVCLKLGPCNHSEDGQPHSEDGVGAWTDWRSCVPRRGPVLRVKLHRAFLLVRELISEHLLYAWMRLTLSWRCPASRWGSWGSGSRRGCKWKSRVMPMPPQVQELHIPPNAWEKDSQRNIIGFIFFFLTIFITCLSQKFWGNTSWFEENKIKACELPTIIARQIARTHLCLLPLHVARESSAGPSFGNIYYILLTNNHCVWFIPNGCCSMWTLSQ